MLLQWVSLEHQSNVFHLLFLVLLHLQFLGHLDTGWIQRKFFPNCHSLHSFIYDFVFIVCLLYCLLLVVCCALFLCMGWVGGKVGPNGINVLSYLRV